MVLFVNFIVIQISQHLIPTLTSSQFSGWFPFIFFLYPQIRCLGVLPKTLKDSSLPPLFHCFISMYCIEKIVFIPLTQKFISLFHAYSFSHVQCIDCMTRFPLYLIFAPFCSWILKKRIQPKINILALYILISRKNWSVWL